MIEPRHDELRDAAGRLEVDYRDSGLHPKRDTWVDVVGYGLWLQKYLTYYQTAGHENAIRRAQNEIAAIEGRKLPFPPAPLPPMPPARTGLVRLDGRCFVDDGGPWNPLGASLFWAPWGVQHDHARLEQNVTWARDRGADVFRAFAEISHAPTWADREVDPDAPGWPDAIAGTMELAQRRGVRNAWTLFAGDRTWTALDGTKRERTLAWYEQVTRQWCLIARHFEHTVQYVEIRNEVYGPTDAEARVLAQIVHAQTPFRVALAGYATSGGLGAFYKKSAADVGTMHVDRTVGERGYRQARQFWGYLFDYGTDVPEKGVSGEPPGIDSSSGPVNDPEKLAVAAITTEIAGGMYVLHSGAGVRGGGIADTTRGRKANLWEQPAMEPALRLIVAAHALLPPDFSNWSRHGHTWATHPFAMVTDVGDQVEYEGKPGTNRQYAATQDGRVACLFSGIRDRVIVRPRQNASLRALSLSTGREWDVDWRAGQDEGFKQADGASVLVVSR